jgi:hypothetical protein
MARESQMREALHDFGIVWGLCANCSAMSIACWIMVRVGFHGHNQCVGLMWVYGALIDLAFEGCSIRSDLFAVHVGRVFMFLRLEHLISCIRSICRNWSVYQVVSHAGCPLTAQLS